MPMRQARDARLQYGARTAGRGHGDGAGGTRNIDQNGSTSALPRRSDASSVRPNLWERFEPYMVNFLEMGFLTALLELSSQRSSRLQYRVGMAVDFHMAPDAGDMAVGADQHRGAKNPEEASAVHGFFTPGT